MAIRVGIGLFTGQIPSWSDRSFAQEYRETIELVRLAESVGFDAAWVSEHHGASDGYLPSLLVMLAAFAEVTTTIRLGTGVILTPFHDPLRLAEDIAVVDQLSQGRLTIGLGLGWRAEEFRMFGVPMQERLARTEETVAILRRAFTGERFSFEGRIFHVDRVRVSPPPAQPGGPPILLGGYVDAALRRAGEIGDGHITDAEDPHHVRKAVAQMEVGARSAGRDPARLHLALMANAFVAEDRAWEIAAPGVFHQLGAYEAWDAGHDTPERDTLDPSLGDEHAARRATAAGTPEEVAHALDPIVRSFGDRAESDLIVRLHYPGMSFDDAAGAVRAFGERVLPIVRDATGTR